MKQFAFELNMLLDNGECLELKETKKHVEDGTVLDWLVEKYPDSKYDTLFEELNSGIRKPEIIQGLMNSQRKINVKNNGICYLVALALN